MTIYDMGSLMHKPHTPMNVWVDGKLMRKVIYVDTEAGVVRYHDEQFKVCEVTGEVTMAPVESGRDELWRWFGLDRASWLTMPRVMMHAMPDDWQAKMSALLREWDATWDSSDLPTPIVQGNAGRGFTKWPGWLLDYRHPNTAAIDALRVKR